MATYTITRNDVDNFDVTRFRENITIALAKYGNDVQNELDTMLELRASFPQQYTQACVIFSIISPQCKFDVNVRGTRRMLDGLYNSLETVNDVYQLITNNGTDSWFTAGMSARSLFASLDTIRELESITVSELDTLVKHKLVRGLGCKTRAMTLALYDQNSPVFTLDVHMLRGMLVPDCATGIAIPDKLYRELESIACEVAQEYGSIFLVQWALWNHYRNGSHESHLPIFGA